jgi:hypothetical protein
MAAVPVISRQAPLGIPPNAVFEQCMEIGYIAQWLERLTADQQVPGSNPGVPSFAPCNTADVCVSRCMCLTFALSTPQFPITESGCIALFSPIYSSGTGGKHTHKLRTRSVSLLMCLIASLA